MALMACATRISAQQALLSDTLRLDRDSAENIFLHNNYNLLAQQYNIDATKALEIQAKLYPNPNLALAQGPLIPTHDPSANFIRNASTSGSLSQLILLAGKRNKQIKLAEANTKLTEYQFFDLIRTLKYTLRNDFNHIYYLRQSAKVYNEEITSLQQVVTAFSQLSGKGYIAEKEVVRIRAQLYNLLGEYSDLVNQITDAESELKLVLQVKPNVFIEPEIDTVAIAALSPSKYPLAMLVDTAYQNRTDLMIAKANLNISKLNYNYQKSLAVPDLSLSLSYDQQGSYVNNFTSLGVAMDLPFFNRNQGNIKQAKILIDANSATQKATTATVEENVYHALEKAFAQDKMLQSIDPKFAGDFDRLMHEVLLNYEKRNIGLLDFLDFYDSYKQNILQLNSIRYNRISAFEDLNFYTGTNLF